MATVLKEDQKCDIEIRTRIGLEKQAFQKLSKVMINWKNSIETKSAELLYAIHPFV